MEKIDTAGKQSERAQGESCAPCQSFGRSIACTPCVYIWGTVALLLLLRALLG
jgi:hypothetical protein